MNNISIQKKLVIAAALAALGFAGNYMALPIAYSVAFIFGSIFSIIAIGLLGPWWGAGVAIAASSYTVILWNHPYALIILLLEALWIGIALKRGKSNIVLIDAIFWLTAGSLLVTLFYGGVMGMATQGTIVVILKQAINGIFNALVASILLNHTPIARLAGITTGQVTYKKLIFHIACAFLMFPTLFLLLYENHREIASMKKNAASQVQTEIVRVEKDLAQWLETYLNATRMVAGFGENYGVAPSAKLQEELEDIKKLYSDFQNVILADSGGTAAGFYPPKNAKGEATIGLNFADLAYYRQMVATGKPVVSDVFTGKSAVFRPIITIAVPVVKKGRLTHFGLGAINLERLQNDLKKHTQKELVITLLDSKGNVIVSTDPSRKQLEKLPVPKAGQSVAVTPDVSLFIPGAKKNSSAMQSWKGAYYFSSKPVTGSGWTVRVEYPVGPLQKALYISSINGLSIIALLFLPMIGIAFALSNYLTRPLLAIARLSSDLASKIEDNDEIEWPRAEIAEISLLVDNFRDTSEAFGSMLSTLKHREQRFRSFVENLNDVLFVLTAAGEFSYVSPQWQTAFGYEVRETIGQPFQSFVHPDDIATCLAALQQIMTTGEKQSGINYRVRCKNGIYKCYMANASLMKDSVTGEFTLFGVGRDVTESLQSEKAQRDLSDSLAAQTQVILEINISLEQRVAERTKELKEDRQLLAGVIEATNAGTWEWNVETRETVFNRQSAEIIGYALEEMSPGTIESWKLYVHPDDIASSKALIEKHVNGEFPYYNLEMRMKHKDGTWIWVMNRGKVTRWTDSGKPLLMQGTYQNINERKQAEQELKESKELLGQILNSTAEAIYGIDTNGLCTFCNQACLDMLGFSSEDEMLGKNMHDLVHHTLPDGSPFPVHECKIFKAFQLGVGTHVDDEFLWRKDGSSFPSEYWSYPQHKSGEIVGAVITFLDITERKQMLEELHNAVTKAEAASRAKSEFLSTMSHEIRTPMNGVIGMTGVLLDTNLSAEQRECAEIVRKSGDNLLCLINDILDFSKIEAGKLDMEIIDFDLRVTLEDSTEMLAGRAGDAGLELICQIEPDMPIYLKGDPGRLRQVISNLAGNAIKFTHKGEVVIRASLETDSDSCATILFEITDTGIGIPQSRLAAVFEPFTQADGSTTRKYGGTGLGLAICRQLAELMGGKIGVHSVDGEGSTFWFTAKFEKQTSEFFKTPEVLRTSDITGVRILVVDDNDSCKTLMTTLLKSWGCRYESAGGGEEALKLLQDAAEQNDPFRVALLDKLMPGMDGLELARLIKSDPLLESTLLIMVTSLAQRGDAATLEKIGFTGYLPKPVRQSLLYDCIVLVLAQAVGTVPISGIITRHTVVETQNIASLQGIRILLAEDNIINQKVALSILGKLGYKADVAVNGLEAVRALELINYDIVLMDCQMPVMDGYEATAVIREPGSKVLNHKVPVIAMTANAMKGDRENCLEAGMDDYLTKPVKKGELAAVLEKWGSPSMACTTDACSQSNDERRTKKNCWEAKKCGREPGGVNSGALGVCVASLPIDDGNAANNGENGGRICWAVAGTLCGGKEQGTFADKFHNCMACKFHKEVHEEEGRFFVLSPQKHDITTS